MGASIVDAECAASHEFLTFLGGNLRIAVAGKGSPTSAERSSKGNKLSIIIVFFCFFVFTERNVLPLARLRLFHVQQ
jgi:hypothetical protein